MMRSENLYTNDNPETSIKGLGFKYKEKATESVEKLVVFLAVEKITRAHAIQAVISMVKRSKHQPHRNANMKEAKSIFRNFIKKHKKSTS